MEAAGWQVQWFGQKTYNGVALLSRTGGGCGAQHPRLCRRAGAGDRRHRGRRARAIGAYFPNGQAPGSDKFAYKMRWLRRAARLGARGNGRAPGAGADGRLQHRPERPRRARPGGLGRADPLHPEERGTSRNLVGLGLHDAFRLFEQPPKSGAGGTTATWPSARTRACASTTSWSARRCAAQVRACAIDKLPRKNERPSDHAPVLDLARDGVAADAQALRGLDAAAARDASAVWIRLAFELPRQRVPHLGLARVQQAAGLALQVGSQPPLAAGHRCRMAAGSPARAGRRRSGTGLQAPHPASARAAGPWASTTWAGAITVSQWQMFSSWRTLPGKSKACSRSSAASVMRLASTPSSRRSCPGRSASASGCPRAARAAPAGAAG
jgi:exodeoxyribonuclease-3